MKMFVSDLDGTLLNGFHSLDSRILKSIDLALNNNDRFVVATGRTYQESAIMLDLQERPIFFINNNGALITNSQGKILFEQQIPSEIIEDLLTQFPELAFDFITKDENYINVTKEQYMGSFHSVTGIRRFIAKNLGKKVINQFLAARKFDQTNETILAQSIIKVNCRMTDPQLTTKFNDYLAQLPMIENHPFAPGVYELTYKGVSKGNAVEKLRQQWQIDTEKVYVFGDGGNDIDMLAKYQNSYATRNGSEEAKAAANYTIGYNWNYAVPREIEKIIRRSSLSE
ncbi:Cof-type HAD-IIB family hydrolase [Fundicoccus culcitae]|uniref:Cof-type HAD-IIB family hydrolase n=1 Tax=Fundicoccus culcitae TaxID=2969821 RepID=A0ABY5P9W8_9LACT|nr:HAD family hydrolase [Fundicoccus culcitae]UUX35401.1 Cof-type HAD-IIB family hydrolase [Fundicoccus culcitae]